MQQMRNEPSSDVLNAATHCFSLGVQQKCNKGGLLGSITTLSYAVCCGVCVLSVGVCVCVKKRGW
jgi:hypothetical protein